MGWELDERGVGRELKPNAGSSKCERSLVRDIAYNVQLRLFVKWMVVFVEFAVKLLLVGLCVWLMWRGASSLFQPSPEQAAPAAAAAANDAVAPKVAQESSGGSSM